ncbi:MAG: alternate-type signal peptide domain-containing protein, partial [Bifidobacteriaceae bacterium]|nr:alternate-type signal peptide domain-containing protein [Bifidobacteriaceae bacterium]
MTINPRNEGERRSRRFKGLVAGAAGVALLLGGSTFALWHDSISASFDDVKHGTLTIAASQVGAKAYDARNTQAESDALANENAKEITLSSFLAVPGDKLELDVPVEISASGDNMKYDLDLAVNSETSVDKHWKVQVS